MHRLVCVYCLVAIANSFSRLVLKLRGFRRRRFGGFAYWCEWRELEQV